MTVVASAPGKLMLCGEYVVARGLAPALAVAVSRRATVRLDVGGARWRVSSEALGLVEAPVAEVPVIAAAVAAAGGALPGGHLVVRSDLGSGPRKPGLGGSAAICVAALGALREATGGDRPTVEEAVRVHREAQGGRGSGYDVATSLRGGVCLYEPEAPPVASTLAWPAGLHAAVIFAGEGSRTPERLARLEAAERRDRAGLLGVLDVVRRGARALVYAWRGGDAATVVDAARLAEEALLALDRAADLGVDEGGVGRLRDLLHEEGVAARTSGAGGGDCLWALDTDQERLAFAVARARTMGYAGPDVAWPGRGLDVRREEAP